MAEEANSRRELLKRMLLMGPLAAAAAVGLDGVNVAAAWDQPGNYTIGGNLGVGTESPSARLEAVGSTNAGLNETVWISAGAGGANSGPSLVFHDRYGINNPYPTWKLAEIGAIYSGNPYGGDLLFYTNTGDVGPTNTNEKMRITKFGNVGIGTTGPGHLLHLQKYGLADLFVETTKSDDRAVFYLWGPPLVGGALSNYLGMELNGGNASRGFYNSKGSLSFLTYTWGGWQYALTMVDVNNYDVYVGIGTPSPGERLDVLGNIRVSGQLIGKAQSAYYGA